MATSDIKIPPDWLRTPAHETRSQLLDARRADQREYVLAHTGAGTPDRKFARSETLFRDWFRRTGVFDQSRPSSTESDAGSSKVATRSALLEQRQVARRIASLAFEPQEIERLADRPKSHELREWWKARDGYVEDPLVLHAESTRLELMRRRGRVVGGLPADNQDAQVSDAGAGRLDRARRKQQPVAPKVTRVQHPMPEAYLGFDRLASATAVRADDIYAQECQSKEVTAGGQGGALRSSPSENAWSLPVSPIKDAKAAKRPRAVRENLFAEGLAQRTLLDQLKAAAAATMASSPAMLSPLTRPRPRHSFTASVSDGTDRGQLQDSPVRCGGFS